MVEIRLKESLLKSIFTLLTEDYHLSVHFPHPGEAVVQVVAALWTDVNVVCVKDSPVQYQLHQEIFALDFLCQSKCKRREGLCLLSRQMTNSICFTCMSTSGPHS